MFERITPEAAGIPSEEVLRLLRSFENRGLRMHSVLAGKGDCLFAECYWKPYDREDNQRMYSQTKTFVGVAVGILAEEGKIDLDAPLCSYFPDKADGELPLYLAAQTVRETLSMQTAGNRAEWWFTSSDRDRTHLYFHKNRSLHPAGTYFAYDSPGSQVLCALVERRSGMPLLDFLRERIFRPLGAFENAEILKTPTGDSWGDSALLARPRDMFAFGRLLMRGGRCGDRQLISADYLADALKPRTSTFDEGSGRGSHGYGYQIWMTERQGDFLLYGMGSQLTLCMPGKDMLFVCTADNQGYGAAEDLIIGAVYDFLYDRAGKGLPEDPTAYAALTAFENGRSLYALTGGAASVPINGKEYVCDGNPMGITRFILDFSADGTGRFRYQNAQGNKTLLFGMGRNVIDRFPQDGYSDGVGGERGKEDFRYRCATSGAWVADAQFCLFSQIIDRYLGNLRIVFCFKSDDAVVRFLPNAENFLGEYDGELIAHLADSVDFSYNN